MPHEHLHRMVAATNVLLLSCQKSLVRRVPFNLSHGCRHLPLHLSYRRQGGKGTEDSPIEIATLANGTEADTRFFNYPARPQCLRLSKIAFSCPRATRFSQQEKQEWRFLCSALVTSFEVAAGMVSFVIHFTKVRPRLSNTNHDL